MDPRGVRSVRWRRGAGVCVTLVIAFAWMKALGRSVLSGALEVSSGSGVFVQVIRCAHGCVGAQRGVEARDAFV